MQVAELAADERDALEADEHLLRSAIIQFVRALETARVVRAAGTARTRAILGKLDPGTPIPNTTDLVGAGSVVREEYLALLDGIDLALANHYDPPASLPLYVKTCGAANILGG